MRGKGREKERERNINVWEKHRSVASCMLLPGDLACNPGMCPNWDSNQRPFTSQAGTQPTEPHKPGQKLHFIVYAITVVLIIPLCPAPPCTTHSLRQTPHHCACPWVMCIRSLANPFPTLYFTSPRLFCTTYSYLLIPSPLHPFSPSHLTTFQ